MAYGAKVMDHAGNPRNSGTIESPDAVGAEGVPGRGNYLVVQLRVASGRIQDVRFQTYGCPGAIASGSALTELVKGRGLDEARAVNANQVLEVLGGLPAGKSHCADMAVRALRKAIDAVAG